MMNLMRRSPSAGLSTFNDFDKLFDDLWQSFSLPATALSLPSANIYSEDDKHMVVELEVPGFDRGDIRIEVEGEVLKISGERTEKAEQKDKKRRYMVRESSTSFARRVVLPEGADTENITAQLDKGMLKVTIPVERPEAKRIEIAGPETNAKKVTAKSETK